MIDTDPNFAGRMIISSILSFSSHGYNPAVTVVKDDTTDLLVQYNYFIRPQQVTATVPGMSNVAFVDTAGKVTYGDASFFAVAHYLDATNNFRNLVITRMNHGVAGSGAIAWAASVAGTSAMTYETMGQPHVIYRKGKVFTSIPVNTGTAGQIGQVYISANSVADGTQTANKLALVDADYEISNCALVADMTTASPATGYNMFLIVTLKNGFYVYIQQLTETLTFTTSALKYHAVGAAPSYVDSGLNNHKSMV